MTNFLKFFDIPISLYPIEHVVLASFGSVDLESPITSFALMQATQEEYPLRAEFWKERLLCCGSVEDRLNSAAVVHKDYPHLSWEIQERIVHTLSAQNLRPPLIALYHHYLDVKEENFKLAEQLEKKICSERSLHERLAFAKLLDTHGETNLSRKIQAAALRELSAP